MEDVLIQLAKAKEKFQQLNSKLLDPKLIANNFQYKKTMKEIKFLTPIVSLYDELMSAKKEKNEAKEILKNNSSEPELKEIAKLQLDENLSKIEKLTEEIKILMIPKNPNDEKDVIIEIRSGAGGEEASLFSANLFRMYLMYAEKKGFKTEILNSNETELNGFKEICFEISGEGAFSRFKFESGVHRVQRVPDTETQGRIHTSTVTVAVLPEAEEVEFELNPMDIKVDCFKASGAGGQHVNKTESAIRLTHIPSGLVVECQDERSQFKNKDKAMKILRSKLFEKAQNEANQKIADERKMQVGTGDRSERIRTYNFPQRRVTDHRINLTLYKIDQILNGDLDELIDALTAKDQSDKIASMD